MGGGLTGLPLPLQVMLGGAWFTRAFGDPAATAPATLLQRAQAAAREQLGLAAAPARAIVRVQQVGDGVGGARGVPGGPGAHRLLPLQACIPQYTLGHWQRTGKAGDGGTRGPGDTQRLPPSACPSVRPAERISRFLAEQRLPLSLVGASYAGVSVNDCIASAKAAVGRLLGG